jgi:hypothetical protein
MLPRSLSIEGIVLNGSASVSIALSAEDGLTQDSLFRASDIAMCVTQNAECVVEAASAWERI